jgi:hypothetical protein
MLVRQGGGMRKDYDDGEMFADPDPSSANTSPEFEDEVFQFYQSDGWKPEDILDLPERKKYERWLRKQKRAASMGDE